MSGHSSPSTASDLASSGAMRIGDWLVQPQLNSLLRSSGEQRRIKPKVMDVLVCLAEDPSGIVTKRQLCEGVWEGAAISDDVLTQAICDLRRALGDDAKNPEYIQTVPKRGYRLIAPVMPLPGTAEGGAWKEPWPPARQALAGLTALLVLALTLIQAGHRLSESALKPQRVETIAVLPFEALSGGAAGNRMAQGFQDSLAVNLTKLLGVSIVSTDELIPSQDGAMAGGAIPRLPNLDAVLKGTLQRSGSRVRVSVQLIDPASGRMIWANEFEGQADDLFLLQDRVALEAVNGLEARRLPQGAAHPQRPRKEAHRAYLRAKHLLSKNTRESMEAAARYFEETVRLDAGFAGGYLGLAQSYLQRGSGFGQVPASQALPQAREAALKALNLQPSIAEAHAVLAAIEAAQLRFQGAEREYQEALALSPGSAGVHSDYGLLLAALGRHEEALRQSSLALGLDPASLKVNTARGQILLYAGQTERAISQLLAALELEPEALAPRFYLYWCYLRQGNPSAQEALFKYYQLLGLPTEALSRLKDAYAHSGVAGVAEAELDWIEQGRHPKIHSPVYRARLYARTQDTGRAVEWLEKAYREGYFYGLELLLVDPVYEALHPDPRFQRLLGQIGFPADGVARGSGEGNLAGLRASNR